MALNYRTGVLTGMGLSLLAAFLLPRWGRPAAKATIKGGLAAYETASETLAQLRETLDDITAEAVFERAVEQAAAPETERVVATPQAAWSDSGEAQPAAAT